MNPALQDHPTVAASSVTPHALRRKGIGIALSIILTIYVVLAISISRSKPPSVDEGWIAVSADNLAHRGNTGNPYLEPTGFWVGRSIDGIKQVNYLNMPLFMVTEAVWFRAFGTTIESMRAFSIGWGGLGLLAWFVIMDSLAGVAVALVGTGLIAIDFTYLWTVADGRMDAMCMTLWSLGIALYLTNRRRSLHHALLCANFAIAASLLTHPNGILGFILLAGLVFRMDRYRLTRQDVVTLAPYLLGLAGWAAYASVHFHFFLHQFGVNATQTPGRLNILNLWNSLWGEIVIRHIMHFDGHHTWSKPVPPYGVLIVFLYWGAWFTLFLLGRRRILTSASPAALVAGLLFGGATVLIGFKAPNYLIHLVPAYAFCLGELANYAWRRGGEARTLAVAGIGLLIFLQASVIQFKITRTEYPDYLAAVNFVNRHVQSATRVFAPTYFFFDLQRGELHDDSKLGLRSHLHPDVVIADPWYSDFWDNIFPYSDSEAWLRVVQLQRTRMDPLFSQGRYTIYLMK